MTLRLEYAIAAMRAAMRAALRAALHELGFYPKPKKGAQGDHGNHLNRARIETARAAGLLDRYTDHMKDAPPEPSHSPAPETPA